MDQGLAAWSSWNPLILCSFFTSLKVLPLSRLHLCSCLSTEACPLGTLVHTKLPSGCAMWLSCLCLCSIHICQRHITLGSKLDQCPVETLHWVSYCLNYWSIHSFCSFTASSSSDYGAIPGISRQFWAGIGPGAATACILEAYLAASTHLSSMACYFNILLTTYTGGGYVTGH